MSREKFTAAANMGIDIRGPMADLTSARDLLKRGAFRDALDSAKRADGAVDTIIQGYRTVEGRLKEMHRAFAETEAFGVQTVRARKLAEVARQAYQERNLADVAKAVDAAAEELRKAERERVMQSIERAEFVLTGVDVGANVAPLEAIHRNLNGFLARGQAGDIVAAREKARATLASVSEELAAFVRARIATAEGLKIDVDEMSDLVRRSRLAFGVQNYHEGLRLLNEANERASKMTALHRQAYNAIASGAAFVAEAK